MCVWIISGLIFWGSFFVCLFCLFVCLERDAHTDTTKKKIDGLLLHFRSFL